MKNRNAIPEHGAKSVDSLRSERDLGNQNNCGLPANIYDLTEKLDIHESLSASRDSVKQENLARRSTLESLNGGGLRECRLESP
jgi:hypothetical protein